VDASPRSISRPLIVLLSALVLLVACTGAPAASPPAATAAPTASAPHIITTPSASPSAAAYPLTLSDDQGTSLTLSAEPERIVSLMPGETEILYRIGLGDRVVGRVEDVADFPPEAKDVPVVATFNGVDAEKIVALEPNLVIAGGNGGTPADAIDKLRSLGLPVLVVYAATVDDVFADIELTGRAVGAPGPAADLAAAMRSGFDQVEAATHDLPKPRVFYETGNEPALYGVADDSFVASMLELAGAAPITTGSSTVWEEPVEKLIAADPEVILLGDAAYGVSAADIAKRPGWKSMTAVKDGAIEPVDDIVITRPGPRLFDGLRQLVAALHPDATLPPGSAAPYAAGGSPAPSAAAASPSAASAAPSS
jgi:iron complex transport system substrate-binding protein